MSAPTYDLNPEAAHHPYLEVVHGLADWVLLEGEPLRPLIESFGTFARLRTHESARSFEEGLVELLALGVLFRARGASATLGKPSHQRLITELVRERRAGHAKRRDTSLAALVTEIPTTCTPSMEPSLADFRALMDWLLASGEYDDEVIRLSGWLAMFGTAPVTTAQRLLARVVGFALLFEVEAERRLGVFTANCESFLSEDWAARPPREDTVQCSRAPLEYHLNMVGAELLNRAWRADFEARGRRFVVMPGCARARTDGTCRGKPGFSEISCTHCRVGCSISLGTKRAEAHGARAFAVTHGSSFSRFLESPLLSGKDTAIIGIACAPGLLGAGWRARARGLGAQCILLDASGCLHWLERHKATTFSLDELGRLLSGAERCGAASQEGVSEAHFIRSITKRYHISCDGIGLTLRGETPVLHRN